MNNARVGVETIIESEWKKIVYAGRVIDQNLLFKSPKPINTILKKYLNWTIIVYAIPIVDETLWIWHKNENGKRYLFANQILDSIAKKIKSELQRHSICFVDVASDYPGVISLVQLGVEVGLGTRGLNNLLLHPKYGSWLQLHALLLEIGHIPDNNEYKLSEDVCINSGNCIRACPAQALRGKKFFRERCSRLVASPSSPKSRAVALTENSYIECAECIRVCPIGDHPERLFEWKRP